VTSTTTRTCRVSGELGATERLGSARRGWRAVSGQPGVVAASGRWRPAPGGHVDAVVQPFLNFFPGFVPVQTYVASV
jgi:hypothetical protein